MWQRQAYTAQRSLPLVVDEQAGDDRMAVTALVAGDDRPCIDPLFGEQPLPACDLCHELGDCRSLLIHSWLVHLDVDAAYRIIIDVGQPCNTGDQLPAEDLIGRCPAALEQRQAEGEQKQMCAA